MKTSSYTTIFYSLLVFLSGLMGYEALNLLMGVVFEVPLAILLFISGILMIAHRKYAHHMAVLCTIPLGIYFGVHFSQSNEFFSGILAALSAVVFIINISQVFHVGEPE